MKICIMGTSPSVIGGPTTFTRNLITYFESRGAEVIADPRGGSFDAILVVNASRNLGFIRKMKSKGIPIVHRLGNVFSLQRFDKRKWTERRTADFRNILMNYYRTRIADHVVYQSQNVKQRWDSKYGESTAETSIIYNGIDLERFTLRRNLTNLNDGLNIIAVEGRQGVDPYNILLRVAHYLREENCTFNVVGRDLTNFSQEAGKLKNVRYIGPVPWEQVVELYHNADGFLSTQILDSGCPNSVLEALACGVPVVGFDVGPLREIINDTVGALVPPIGDVWEGQDPSNIPLLGETLLSIAEKQIDFSSVCRNFAESNFSIQKMGSQYYSLMEQVIARKN